MYTYIYVLLQIDYINIRITNQQFVSTLQVVGNALLILRSLVNAIAFCCSKFSMMEGNLLSYLFSRVELASNWWIIFQKTLKKLENMIWKKTHVLNTSWHLTFVFLMLCKCKFFWIQLGTLTLCSMKHKCQTAHPGDEKSGRSSASQEMTSQGQGIAWLDGKHKEVLLKLEISQIKHTEHDSKSSACLKDATMWKLMNAWRITVHCSSAPDMIENTTRTRAYMSQRYDPQQSIQKLCDDSPIHAQIKTDE